MSMWSAGRAATRDGCRTLLIYHRTASEDPQLNTTAPGDDYADGLAGDRILGQGRVIHALKYLESPRLDALFVRNGFVGVGRH